MWLNQGTSSSCSNCPTFPVHSQPRCGPSAQRGTPALTHVSCCGPSCLGSSTARRLVALQQWLRHFLRRRERPLHLILPAKRSIAQGQGQTQVHPSSGDILYQEHGKKEGLALSPDARCWGKREWLEGPVTLLAPLILGAWKKSDQVDGCPCKQWSLEYLCVSLSCVSLYLPGWFYVRMIPSLTPSLCLYFSLYVYLYVSFSLCSFCLCDSLLVCLGISPLVSQPGLHYDLQGPRPLCLQGRLPQWHM